ncbi:MAG TPA: right-handed parallel beta-helix repeat-containing protein, partial [Bacteroidales bacterium]|nr:right-handed parallel beta-helix repeat-containing protein [Bacteroidales bacterium]
MKSKITFLLMTFLLGMLLSANAQNTIESSTMIFQGSLAPDGDGSYTGTIPMANEAALNIGDNEAGFDVYARNGAQATYDKAGSGTDYACGAVSDHDAYTTVGGWGVVYDPDCADYEHYQLRFENNNWYLEYHVNGTAHANPMSGTINWTLRYASETGAGAYYIGMGTPESNGYALNNTCTGQNSGVAAWDMDWSWGSEYIPLEYPGFDVNIETIGSEYRITLTPAASSSMEFQGTLTNNGSGEYSGTIMLTQAFDNYAMVGSTVVSTASSINGQQVGSDHDAYPNWNPDVPDLTYYALHLDGSTDTWELWYLNTPSNTSSGAAYIPLSGDIFWSSSYVSEENQNWAAVWSWGLEDIKYAFPGFELDITDNGGENYTVKLIPAAAPAATGVVPAGPVVNNNTGESYGTIQSAINAATAGDVIEVAAGNYAEQLTISKTITLKGPNFGTAGNGSRVAEAVVTFPEGLTEYQDLVIITADNVVIDGFNFDGQNYTPSDGTSGLLGYGDNIKVRNNIISNFNYVSVWFSSYSPDYPNPSGYDFYRNGIGVESNYIHNAAIFNETNGSVIGYGIYMQGAYGTVSDNIVENTKDAIQIQPYNHPNTGNVTGTVSNNTFEGYREPVWFNYSENINANWAITNNTLNGIAAPTGVTEAEWRGFRVQTCSADGALVFSSNTINIGTANATAKYALKKFSNVVAGMVDLDAVFTNNTWERCAVISNGTNILDPAGSDVYFYLNIQESINAATAGDVIEVAAGTYSESLLINKALTINGENGAVLDGTGLGLITGVAIKSGNVTFNNIDVTNFGGNGIVVGYEATTPGNLQNVQITNCLVSNIQPGSSQGFGIYVGYESEGFGYNPPKLTSHLDYTGLEISGNEITNTANAALVLQSITGTEGSPLTISDNHFYEADASGIWIDCARELSIIGNEINGNNHGFVISQLTDYYALNGTIGPKDIDISNNDIYENTNYGLWLWAGWTSTITINENKIYLNGTKNVSNLVASTLDATCNWWNTTDAYEIAAAVSGDVQFLPFSTSADPMNCLGVGPVVNTTQSLSYMTIQAAIDAANAGDVIEVAAGTYTENVTVNKNISLIGADAATTIIDGVQAGSQTGAVVLTAGRDGVSIKNLHIKGIDGPSGIEKAAIYMQGAQTNITIEDNIIEARGDAALMGEWNAANNGITITGNNFIGQTFIGDEPATGDQFTVPNVARQAIVFGGGASTSNTQNFTFTNNTVATIAAGNIYGNTLVTLDLVGNNIITQNEFSGKSSAHALRVRGTGTYTIEENSFSGVYPLAIFRQGNMINAPENYWGSCPSFSGEVEVYPYYTTVESTAGSLTFGGQIDNIVAKADGSTGTINIC